MLSDSLVILSAGKKIVNIHESRPNVSGKEGPQPR